MQHRGSARACRVCGLLVSEGINQGHKQLLLSCLGAVGRRARQTMVDGTRHVKDLVKRTRLVVLDGRHEAVVGTADTADEGVGV